VVNSTARDRSTLVLSVAQASATWLAQVAHMHFVVSSHECKEAQLRCWPSACNQHVARSPAAPPAAYASSPAAPADHPHPSVPSDSPKTAHSVALRRTAHILAHTWRALSHHFHTDTQLSQCRSTCIALGRQPHNPQARHDRKRLCVVVVHELRLLLSNHAVGEAN
jgi:hypothetical protein